MKMLIKSLIGLAALGFAFPASALEAYPTEMKVNYTIPSYDGNGDQVYYNCRSVESSVEKILENLGAEDIRVRCSGGIDHSIPTDAFVRASFVAASSVKNNQAPRAAVVKTVDLRDNGSCHLYSETLSALSESLEMEVVVAPRTCRLNSRIRNQFQVNVLAFE